MTSISKRLTTFIKKNEKTLDIVLPIFVGLIILFMISYAFLNKKEYYSNDPDSEKNKKFPVWAIAFIIVVVICILYFIFTDFYNKFYKKSKKMSSIYGKSNKSKTIN